MPVENIYADGSIMYNMKPEGADISECYWSLYNDIHEDEDLPEDIVASAKAGKEKYWRYLTPAQARVRRQHLADVRALQLGEEVQEHEPAPTTGTAELTEAKG